MAFIKVCGNLTKKEITVHTTKTGEEFVTFTLCDNPYKKDRDSEVYGEMVAYKVVCWGEFAQLMKKEAMPGRQVTVKGILSPCIWKQDDKELRGVEIKAIEITLGRIPNNNQPINVGSILKKT